MNRIKKFAVSLALALTAIVVTVVPALAIALPDSAPTIQSINVFRNILETGDMGFFIYENTPYAVPPTDFGYGSAYVWRLIDTDGTTELAQALGYEYHDDGYGFNVIHFYLSAANVTSLGVAWQDALFLRLSGTPAAFVTPPVYNFSISSSDYSSYTATADVKSAIADLIRIMAADLNNDWALSSTTTLLDDSETGVVLSVYGQAFFRGAIFGVQSMAPAVFPLVISDVNVTPRTWTTNYTTALAAQSMGTDIDGAVAAGETLLDVSYNLFGLLLVLGMCIVLIVGNWMVSGNGSLWKGGVEAAAPLVISARLGMLGFGELGLIAAICWLYVSAKLWRMI